MFRYHVEIWRRIRPWPVLFIAALYAVPVRGAPPDAEREAYQQQKAVRAANLLEFQKAFEHGKSLSVRQHLEYAATVTGELAALAEVVSDTEVAAQMAQAGYTTRVPIYPRTSHLIRLMGARPWIRDQFRGDLGVVAIDSADMRWPTTQEQPELRRLTHDTDPDIKAMAIEALATLYDPDDLQLIAQVQPASNLAHFGAATPTVPVLSMQHPIWGNGWPGQLGLPDPIRLDFYWRSSTVADHAERAMSQLTGANITHATFKEWVARHGATRNSLWYWQQQLQRRFGQHEMSTYRLVHDTGPESMRLLETENAKFRKSIRTELAMLDRQAEAKVMLIANHEHAGTTDIDEPFQRFFDPPWQTRLTKDELFNLLEGGRPWNDVDWVDQQGNTGEVRTRVVTRIMLSANQSFAFQDVSRLQKLIDNPPSDILQSGRAAILIGISQLLPAANAEDLKALERQDRTGQQSTRDGYLRMAIDHEADISTRGYVARELVRVGLPNNGSFLRDRFFAEEDGTIRPDVRSSIFQALGHPPLTAAKRKLLVELVTDKRCRHILTRRIEKLGDGAHRRYAWRSINAYADREPVTESAYNDLFIPEKADESLDRILENLKQW